MKTLTGTDNHFLNSKQQPCESTKDSSFWRPLRQLRSACSFIYARVLLEARAGLGAASKATSNNRIYVGLILVLVAAPLVSVGYQVFDPTMNDKDWYYTANYYLFFTLCPHLSLITSLTGVFFLFPESRRSYFLAVPISYHFGKVMWLIQVDSNEAFHSVIPVAFWITALVTAAFYLVSFNYLMGLHFHGVLGPLCRLEGLRDLHNVPAEERLERMAQPMEELRNALK